MKELLRDQYRMGAVDILAVVAAEDKLHSLRLVGPDSLHHLEFVLPERHSHLLQIHMLGRHIDVFFAQRWTSVHPRLGREMHYLDSRRRGGPRIDRIGDRADLVLEEDSHAEERPLLAKVCI